jgi:hypothetical protein
VSRQAALVAPRQPPAGVHRPRLQRPPPRPVARAPTLRRTKERLVSADGMLVVQRTALARDRWECVQCHRRSNGLRARAAVGLHARSCGMGSTVLVKVHTHNLA